MWAQHGYAIFNDWLLDLRFDYSSSDESSEDESETEPAHNAKKRKLDIASKGSDTAKEKGGQAGQSFLYIFKSRAQSLNSKVRFDSTSSGPGNNLTWEATCIGEGPL